MMKTPAMYYSIKLGWDRSRFSQTHADASRILEDNGFVRITNSKTITAIQTTTLDNKTLRYIQNLVDVGAILLNKDVVWGNYTDALNENAQELHTYTTYEQLMQAKYVQSWGNDSYVILRSRNIT